MIKMVKFCAMLILPQFFNNWKETKNPQTTVQMQVWDISLKMCVEFPW